MTRNHLAGSHGDAANAVLAAVGYNFRLILRWLRLLCALLIAITAEANSSDQAHQTA